MKKETLNPDEVHLWFVFPEEIQTPDLLSAYQQLLSEDEKVKKQRLRYERLRHQYLISRAFVRTTLSRYCSTHPAEWSFYNNKHGRPEIIPRRDAPELRFNLSHTRGLMSCGVALREDIGVDVEEICQRKILLEIAQKHFSAREVDDLSNLLPHQQKDRFFDYWTLKESYIKARGRGLSLPLNRFCFQLSPSRSLSIFFDPGLREKFTGLAILVAETNSPAQSERCNPSPNKFQVFAGDSTNCPFVNLATDGLSNTPTIPELKVLLEYIYWIELSFFCGVCALNCRMEVLVRWIGICRFRVQDVGIAIQNVVLSRLPLIIGTYWRFDFKSCIFYHLNGFVRLVTSCNQVAFYEQ